MKECEDDFVCWDAVSSFVDGFVRKGGGTIQVIGHRISDISHFDNVETSDNADVSGDFDCFPEG